MIKCRTTAIAIACAAIVAAAALIHAQQAPTVKRTVLLQHPVTKQYLWQWRYRSAAVRDGTCIQAPR